VSQGIAFATHPSDPLCTILFVQARRKEPCRTFEFCDAANPIQFKYPLKGHDVTRRRCLMLPTNSSISLMFRHEIEFPYCVFRSSCPTHRRRFARNHFAGQSRHHSRPTFARVIEVLEASNILMYCMTWHRRKSPNRVILCNLKRYHCKAFARTNDSHIQTT